MEPQAIDPEAIAIYHQGVELHRKRRLSEAMRHYRDALQWDPAREPSAEEADLIVRHAPRLFTTPHEPLPLKDVAAILHPELPIVGYHLFWEDDIDFPANSDPCDHEVAWVQLDEQEDQVVAAYAFYHGVVIPSPAAAHEARWHGGRPRIDVQWGKHGLLPFDWQAIGEGQLIENMRSTYQRLHTEGCRQADYPLARHWPHRFDGRWEDFVDFRLEVDPRNWLQRNRMMMVGHLANAIIDWFFLRYNFYPKFSWPDLDHPGGGVL
jgi:hypothetical protein